MSNDSDQNWQGNSPLSPLPATRRRWPWFLLIMILALAYAGFYAWPEIMALVPNLGQERSSEGMTTGDKEALQDLLATQRKSEADLAALGRAVADQQEQLKIIVDQLLGLTSKLDALQRAAPAAVTPVSAAAAARAPIVQTAPRPRKPPSRAPEPSGAISTGGAPLSVAPDDADH
jgi:hypothetical protein